MLRALPNLLAILLVVLACAGCDGEPDRPARRAVQPMPEIRPPVPWPSDAVGEDHPAAVVFPDGQVWLALSAWDGESDGVVLRELLDEASEDLLVERRPGHVQGTALAIDAQGLLRVVWSAGDESGFGLRERRYRRLGDGGDLVPVGEAQDLLAAPGARCLAPRLAHDGAGRLLLVYTVLDGDRMTLRAAASRDDGSWSAPVEIPDQDFSNWAPAVTARGPGRFAVAWDAAVEGDYDVLLALLDVDDAGPRVTERLRVTDSPRFEAHAAVAAAGERLYVAYEVGHERWGREGSHNKLEEALHWERVLEIVALEDGRLAPLAVDFMGGVERNLRVGCEKPALHVDGNGNLLLAFRGLPLPEELKDPDAKEFQALSEERGGGGTGWRTSIWYTYLSRFDGLVWSYRGRHNLAIPGSNGRSDAPLSFAALPRGGAVLATAGDGREREVAYESAGNEKVYGDGVNWWKPATLDPPLVTAQRIAMGEPVAPLPLDAGRSRALPAWRGPSAADRPALPTRQLADGTAVQLALGDLHRHTDLSRCSSNWDGPFSDAMRYAFDAGLLQFVAVTDHFEHMNAWDWWRNRGLMETWHAPGRMVNLRAYERADARTGHRNVIGGEAPLPVIGYRNQFHPPRDAGRADKADDLWPVLEGQEVITIPHTPAGMFGGVPCVFDWLSFNPEHDRLVEIFQGYRGSSEDLGAPRVIDVEPSPRFVRHALDGGLHFGFIASSDHQSSFGSFAGAWVTGLTRGEVFDALHARRTFGSTCRMALWAEWAGLSMGQAGTRPAGETGGLFISADALGRELATFELIVDGRVSRTVEVDGTRAEHLFTAAELSVPASGSRYAYVRVTTADGELGWTSPTRLCADGSLGSDGPWGKHAFDAATGPALEERLGFPGPDPLFGRWEGPQADPDERR